MKKPKVIYLNRWQELYVERLIQNERTLKFDTYFYKVLLTSRLRELFIQIFNICISPTKYIYCKPKLYFICYKCTDKNVCTMISCLKEGNMEESLYLVVEQTEAR